VKIAILLQPERGAREIFEESVLSSEKTRANHVALDQTPDEPSYPD
jgi:hypothetical protein